MRYADALEELESMINLWQPEGEVAELLETACYAIQDCLKMGLDNDTDDGAEDEDAN